MQAAVYGGALTSSWGSPCAHRSVAIIATTGVGRSGDSDQSTVFVSGVTWHCVLSRNIAQCGKS